ncbi:hypothetical protein EV641_103274 [Rhodococcus sp. SMB37]|nr:hypothetical protein EV641_103274 [Rhodococcus sp. SMB37]
MGKATNWVIVEGRIHDRAFYSRLLESISPNGYARSVVMLAETLTVEGQCAGGKPHMLKLYDSFKTSDTLLQENVAGQSAVIFFLDRDLDDYLTPLVPREHLIFTQNMDVESEIFAHAKLDRALCATHGLDQVEVSDFFASIPQPTSNLFKIWRMWIKLRLISLHCEIPNGRRFSQPSKINSNTYGEVCNERYQAIHDELQKCAQSTEFEDVKSRVESDLENIIALQREYTLVPGKWIPGYLRHLIEERFRSDIVRKNVSDLEITTACLQSIEFSDSWTSYYETQLQSILVRS